ncbi:MAG TPA: YbhB/YbcL family Raf kinase inhibitor-like protein [Methanoregula sp.]|nr:YbhB/YbcL family Raf kinase inhibitor-like protein [Methanoregula sp.]
MDKLVVSLDFLEFPPAHMYRGGNSSPGIRLDGLDSGSVAVMVFNPSIRGVLSYCTWLIWDIPARKTIPAGIPAGGTVTDPVPAIQGTNDAGVIGYTGPDPKPGEIHRYLFRIYGLDDFLRLPGGSGKSALLSAMHGHILQYGETEAVASRVPPLTGEQPA